MKQETVHWDGCQNFCGSQGWLSPAPDELWPSDCRFIRFLYTRLTIGVQTVAHLFFHYELEKAPSFPLSWSLCQQLRTLENEWVEDPPPLPLLSIWSEPPGKYLPQSEMWSGKMTIRWLGIWTGQTIEGLTLKLFAEKSHPQLSPKHTLKEKQSPGSSAVCTKSDLWGPGPNIRKTVGTHFYKWNKMSILFLCVEIILQTATLPLMASR